MLYAHRKKAIRILVLERNIEDVKLSPEEADRGVMEGKSNAVTR